MLLGGPKFFTIEVAINIHARQRLNLPAAALLSLVQLRCTLAINTIYSRYVTRITSPLKPRAAWANARPPKKNAEKFFLAGMLTVVLVFFYPALLGAATGLINPPRA